jgi:hypothetical protein
MRIAPAYGQQAQGSGNFAGKRVLLRRDPSVADFKPVHVLEEGILNRIFDPHAEAPKSEEQKTAKRMCGYSGAPGGFHPFH